MPRVMNNHVGTGVAMASSILAEAFTRRITQLGISRRELTKRTGLSRQTLHNVEHGGSTELKPATLQALDRGLYWRPGTSHALSQGDESALDTADATMHADKESAYRWRIVERIQRMSLAELERIVAYMETQAFGDEPLTTESVIERVEEAVYRRIEQRLSASGDNGQSTAS